jgi:hypothetical protein
MFSFLYNAGKLAILSGAIQPLVHTLKVALVTAAYMASKDGHDFFNDVSGEVSGTGYAAGGQALSGVSLAQDNAADRAGLHASDLTWAVGTFIARGAVLYKDSGNPATSPLIAFMDFGENRSVAGQDFTLEWNPDGDIILGE